MNRSDIQRGLDATVEPLSEITRASVWQRIEDAIATPAPRRSRFPAIAMFAAGMAVAAAVAILVVGRRAPAGERIVVVVPPAGEYHRAFAGGELIVYGPGELELDPTLERPALRIQHGTVLVRRSPVLPPLEVTTPEASRTVHEPVVALHVTELATELASGEERARALIERHVHELAPPTAQRDGDPSAAPLGAAAPASNGPTTASTPSPAAPTNASSTPPTTSSSTPPTTSSLPTPGTSAPTTSSSTPPTIASTTPGTTAPTTASTALAPSPTDASTAAPPETLPARYVRAERAIANGDTSTARELLEAIARDDADGRLGAAASYDLALLAVKRGDRSTALRLLERVLLSNAEPSLHGPAQRLQRRLQTATPTTSSPQR